MNQNTKETTNVEPPKLTYYQRNRDTLRAKARAKYAEKKNLESLITRCVCALLSLLFVVLIVIILSKKARYKIFYIKMKVSRLTRLRLLKRTRSKYETNIYNNRKLDVGRNYKGFYYNWFIYLCHRCSSNKQKT